MIRWSAVLRIMSYVLTAAASIQLPMLILALVDGDPGVKPFLSSILITVAAAALLYRGSNPLQAEINNREGIVIVAGTWIMMSLSGALPLYLSPYFSSVTDAVFESVSGFTTTGSTVLSSVEILPRSIQLWRHVTHWIGGMGIIVLGIAILPLIGVGGMVLYRAEFSGAHSEKLTPRIAETATSLWKIYAALTLLLYCALRMAGMNSFESICLTFSTMGTGGFSTRDTSIAAFHSYPIEMIILVFMLISGTNFTLQYRLIIERRPRRFFQDTELRFYLSIALIAGLAVAAALMFRLHYSAAAALRASFFQVTSIMTTTGFASEDFELWPSFAQLVLLALMFFGGCTGSTAGGLKTARVAMLFKVVWREFKQMAARRGVFSVRFGDQPVSENAVQGLLNLVYLSFLINFGASLILTALGIDILTAISAVAASMFNAGPGLGEVGPFNHYGQFPAAAKWTLSLCMLAGRLEFYTLVILFTPGFWRK